MTVGIRLEPLLTALRLPDATSLKLRYSSDIDDLVNDFFVPTLGRAVRYDRAVGYFTAGAIARLAPALVAFVDRVDGPKPKIRVVASPNLPQADLHSLEQGYQRRSLEEEVLRPRPEFTEALSAVSWMIEHDFIEFFLVPGYKDGTECLYHEKIGVIEDLEGNFVTFEGSPNETASGLDGNIESFPVHRSWVANERPHADAAKAAVDDLFDPNGSRPLKIESFPRALAENFVKTYIPRRPTRSRKSSKRGHTSAMTGEPEVANLPELPPTVDDFRSYQRDAIGSWLKADGRGLFSMATGTGKTITALGALARLSQVYSDAPGLTAVVLVPDTSLVDMWAEEVQSWGVEPICSTYNGKVAKLRSELQRQRVFGGTTIAVWTTGSAANSTFRAALRDFPSPRLLIADECHAMGSTENQKLLTDDFHYRLGLSATIERNLDPDGTQLLHEYFGEVLIDIGIKEAIELGALCPYKYWPVLVPLSSEEMGEYSRLTGAIGMKFGGSRGLSIGDLDDSAKMLLIKRARLLWHAEAKVGAFREVLESLSPDDLDYSLIYTAEGVSPLTAVRQDPQIHEVAESLGLDYREFDGNTPLDERSELLRQLGEGEIDGLVAMKCLDQGIDVPTARVAHFLASTRNPRQYVQRRGRILRKPKDGAFKKAIVFDYISHPESVGDNFDMERRLVAQEVLRAMEMASAAENRQRAINALAPLLDQYNLWDSIGEE